MSCDNKKLCIILYYILFCVNSINYTVIYIVTSLILWIAVMPYYVITVL